MKVVRVVFAMSRDARAGRISREVWGEHQMRVLDALEASGGRVVIEGAQHAAAVDGPCVVIANHMSTIETLFLPSILQPWMDITLVVKESLMEYPVFGPILKALGMIPVTRRNAREDLKQVLTRGTEFIGRGYTVMVFPQATRSTVFDPDAFNSIGIKLAQRAGVPVLPVCLKTDFQKPGRLIKDFGRIDPSREVRFRMGEAFEPGRDGRAAHRRVVQFIGSTLHAWDPDNVAESFPPALPDGEAANE